ncbi:MAG: molybdenum cofactor guanylyltransferase MobA [Emcibacteraceae bacterium]
MHKEEIKKSHLLGVILAGGQSRRMGGDDKFLLTLGKRRIIDHIVDRLESQVDRIILNSNLAELDITIDVVPDIPDFGLHAGPMIGLYTALNYAKRHSYQKIVTVSADTPFIPDNFVEMLLHHSSASVVVAKSNGHLHPTHALWDVSLLDDLEKALKKGERKMMSWLKTQKAVELEWSDNPDPFFNINTPENLIEAEKLAGRFKRL